MDQNMEKKEQPKEQQPMTIFNADFQRAQLLFDAANPESALVVTVHQRNGKCYGAVWQTGDREADIEKLAELTFPTDKFAEIMVPRLLIELASKHPDLENDERTRLAMIGLVH
jgi:hypothetical protein